MDLISIIQIAGCLIAAFSKSSVSRNIEHRIFDGYKASIYDFPYMLSLHYDDIPWCGAAIIGAHYALTAAHCVNTEYRSDQFEFRSGSSFKNSGGTTHKINSMDIHVHEGWLILHMVDIALVYVEKPFLSNDSVARAAILPNSSYVPPPGVNAIVAGWGSCNNCPLYKPEQFNVVELPLIPKARCKTLYPSLTQYEMCAGYEHIQKGTSKGDSGGPLVINGVLIGLVSWGNFPYPMAKNPDVYADVVALSDWVRSKMAKIESEKNKINM